MRVCLTLEAKKCDFSYSIRAIQNRDKTLMTLTYTNFDSRTSYFSSCIFTSQCHCQVTKMSGWAVTFSTSLLFKFTFPIIICHARGSSESLQLLESKHQQNMQRKHDTFQVNAVCTRAGQDDLQGVHICMFSY